jgi:hypothetical protein
LAVEIKHEEREKGAYKHGDKHAVNRSEVKGDME